MKNWQKIFIVCFILTLLTMLILINPKDNSIRSSVVQISQVEGDFALVNGPRHFDFPEDYGAHEEYQTEWWYYTGNLENAEGRHFGYQLTFFRRALQPADEKIFRNSDWAADQVFLAHFAITDVLQDEFYYSERIQRGAAGLAGAIVNEQGFSVWLENWQVRQESEEGFRLFAENDGLQLDLLLSDLKGVTPQGENGFSPKGSETGNASYYFSQTRLESTGFLKIDGQTFEVMGLSWMDHEFSTSALGADLVGWDWYSLQLNNQSELMLFTLRDAEGNISSFSSGNYLSSTGENYFLDRSNFEIQVLDNWKSKNSGAEYPSAWRISIPELELTLEITPYIKDQELLVSFIYWEGAVMISGDISGSPVSGSGYIELTGYAQSMQGQL